MSVIRPLVVQLWPIDIVRPEASNKAQFCFVLLTAARGTGSDITDLRRFQDLGKCNFLRLLQNHIRAQCAIRVEEIAIFFDSWKIAFELRRLQ